MKLNKFISLSMASIFAASCGGRLASLDDNPKDKYCMDRSVNQSNMGLRVSVKALAPNISDRMVDKAFNISSDFIEKNKDFFSRENIHDGKNFSDDFYDGLEAADGGMISDEGYRRVIVYGCRFKDCGDKSAILLNRDGSFVGIGSYGIRSQGGISNDSDYLKLYFEKSNNNEDDVLIFLEWFKSTISKTNEINDIKYKLCYVG